MKNYLKYIAVASIALIVGMTLSHGTKDDFGLGRNMEIAINMMRTLSEKYVDEISPDNLMQAAGDGMVRNLDPYTEFLSEQNMEGFEVMTTGKYGGIGSLIRQRGDYVAVAEPYKGSPADSAGLKIGDLIIKIDGDDAKGFSTADVSKRLKGVANTSVKLTILNVEDSTKQKISLRRQQIAIPGIPYADFVGKGIGYIKHTEFTTGCAQDMRNQIAALQSRDTLHGLILDYRDNGGGILQEAINIVSMFVDPNTPVVTTKGRRDSMVMRTEQSPILRDLPLVVLINGNSASAAEIVTGALQDLDRAVVIGSRSFGKGLVQSPYPLGYNSYVKLTTAKYYIPSGRCIQAIDYSAHNNASIGKELPDSLIQQFHTKGGRKVYDGGGIMPDVKVKPQYISRFAMTLYGLGYIDDFADRYYRNNYKNKIDIANFTINNDDYKEFEKMVESKDFEYESDTRRVMKMLKQATKNDRYKELEQKIEAIEKDLNDNVSSNCATYRKQITDAINSAIVLRWGYREGVIRHSLTNDRELKEAQSLLGDTERYNHILDSVDLPRK